MDQSVNFADWHYIGVEVAEVATQTASVAVDATERAAEETVTTVVAQGSSAAAAAAGAAAGSGAGFTFVAVGAAAATGGLLVGMLLMRWRNQAGVKGIVPPGDIAPVVKESTIVAAQEDTEKNVAVPDTELLTTPFNVSQPEKLLDVQTDLPIIVQPITDQLASVADDTVVVADHTSPVSATEVVAEVVRLSAVPPPEPLQNDLSTIERAAVASALTRTALPPPELPAPTFSRLALPAPPEPAAPSHEPPAPAHSTLTAMMDPAFMSEKIRFQDYAVPLLAASVLVSSALMGRALWRFAAAAAPAKRPPIHVPAASVAPAKSLEATIDMVPNTGGYFAPTWPIFERVPLTAVRGPSKCGEQPLRSPTTHGCWPETPALPQSSAMPISYRQPPPALASVDVEMSVMATALGGRLGPTGERADVRVVSGVVRPAAATSSRVFRILPKQ